MDWTDASVSILTSRWAAGHNSRAIANELGTTRGAVIGKAHRLHLPGPEKKQAVVRINRVARTKPRKPAKFPFLARQRAPAPQAGPVTFCDLQPRHCRWMRGEPSEQLYCGADRRDGSIYCSTHHNLAYPRPR